MSSTNPFQRRASSTPGTLLGGDQVRLADTSGEPTRPAENRADVQTAACWPFDDGDGEGEESALDRADPGVSGGYDNDGDDDDDSIAARRHINTRVGQGEGQKTSRVGATEHGSRIPSNAANPFDQAPPLRDHSESIPRPAIKQSHTRASLDVDAFKRLLMTGSAGNTLNAGGTAASQTGAVDTASSTDASSVSRHSLFDALHEAAPGTPRTSHEISDVDEEGRRLEDKARLLSAAGATARRKPPPPSSRHGKLIRSETRQDGSSTPPTPMSSSSTPVVQPGVPEARRLSRASTDLNKPLPPPPRRTSHDLERPPSVASSRTATTHDGTVDAEGPEQARKSSLPLPPKRLSASLTSTRYSQDSMHMLPVDETGLGIPQSAGFATTRFDLAEQETARPGSSGASKAPPPPPTRRSNSVKIMPNSPMSSHAPPSRSASIHSRLGKRYSYQSPESARNSPLVPPLPPPPRRARGSDDAGAVFGEAHEQGRGPLATSPEPIDGASLPDATSLLDDIDRLQRDIDEMRFGEEMTAAQGVT